MLTFLAKRDSFILAKTKGLHTPLRRPAPPPPRGGRVDPPLRSKERPQIDTGARELELPERRTVVTDPEGLVIT